MKDPMAQPLIFALVSPDSAQSVEASDKLRELTIAWSRYGYHGELIEDRSIDQALTRAAQTGAHFCLLQSAGHVIDEQWYLSHWQWEGFYQGIGRLMQEADFLLAGEWFVSEQGCAGVATDCLLVDLQRYQALGQPAFGEADHQTRTMQAVTLQSGRTKSGQLPLEAQQLLPADAGSVLQPGISDAAGWHVIQTSLQHGLAVRRFGNDINDCRFDLAKNADDSEFTRLIGRPVDTIDNSKTLTTAQQTFIGRIKKQLEDAQKGAFLFNIESYDDLVQQPDATPLDALFSVAAGFKPYRILSTQGYHDDTQVVLFDYSQKALDVRRHIVENWDGADFPGFVRQLFERYPQPEVFYQLWYGATPETLDWADMEQLWQLELDKWGGAQAFKQHWQQLRKLPHQYLHCDLLQDRQALLDELARYNNSYIWWSNAFFTIFSHWHYAATERKAQYLDWIKALSGAAPDCQINGADHNNIAVNGLSAQQYFQQFKRQYCDELTPQRLHSVDIQF